MNRPERRHRMVADGWYLVGRRTIAALGGVALALCLMAACGSESRPTPGGTAAGGSASRQQATTTSGSPAVSSPPTPLASREASPEAPPGGVLSSGTWGGEGIALHVADDGSGTVEFDCAVGRVPGPLAVHSGGAFAWRGEYTQEIGGPVGEGGQPPPRPARYVGAVAGAAMTLRVELLDGDETVGPFDLFAGQAALLRKCQ